MIFNCDHSHPYKLFIEYINSTEESDLIFDYIESIDTIQFGNMRHASSGSLMIIDDDLRRLAEILNETDFVSVLTNRYLDSMKSSISNSKNHDIEITLRLGEFRERMIEHWSNLSKDELQTIQRAFRDQQAHKDEYSEYFNLRIMENNLNRTDFSINRTRSLERMCEVHVSESKSSTSNNIETPISIDEFQQHILPEIEKIKTPIDNRDFLGLMNMPKLNVSRSGNEEKISDILLDIFNINQDTYESEIKNEVDIEEEYKSHKKILDSLKVFSGLMSRNEYLKLDETYSKIDEEEDGEEHDDKKECKRKKDRLRKLDSFNRQKKRTYDAFHPTSQENWVSTADSKKKDNQEIGHSNGLITICYWRLYNSNNKLFKDLKTLDTNKSTDLIQYLNIIISYYTFINEELLINVVTSIVNKHKSTKARLEEEWEKAEADLSLVDEDKNTSGKEKAVSHRQKKYLANAERSNNLEKACQNLIKTHFNLNLVEQILKVYCEVFNRHKLILEKYQYQQKIITFY